MKVTFEGSIDEVIDQCSTFLTRLGGSVQQSVPPAVASPGSQAASGTSEEKRGRGRPPKTPTDSVSVPPATVATPVTTEDDLFGDVAAPPAPAPAKQYTKEEFTKVITVAVQKHGQEPIRTILKEFGATKLAEVDPSNYAAIVAKLA